MAKAKRKIELLAPSRRTKANDMFAERRKLLWIRQGKMDDALPLAQHDLEKAITHYGISDFRTAIAGESLARIYLEKQEFEKAIDCFEKSLTCFRDVYGQQHPATLVRVMNLAVANRKAKRFVQADVLFSEYQDIHSDLKRYEGPHFHSMLLLWAESLGALGKVEDAEELLQRCEKFNSTRSSPELIEQCKKIRASLAEPPQTAS